MPFIRRSTLNALRARVETYAQAARDERRTAAAALANSRALAAKYVEPGEALTALAEARRQIDAKERRIRLLQDQLDELLGMNDPRVRAGANWQAHREDKPQGVKP
ncbi:hypothetical protein ACFVDT_07170 [Streptomyces sp. NPDC057699]|uniref:hypothetical protein n=1 Tax=Streptomyces sp. NPDC057699 TaxID=3346220 RepID=UPI0036CA1D92